MNSYQIEYTLTNANQNYFADNATGTTITLDHNATPDSYAYKVAILNNGSNDLSSINFIINGLDADGKSQSEILTGPTGSATVYSTYYYSSVTSITLSSTLGSNKVDIGTSSYFCSKTFVLTTDKTASIALDLKNGSINYTGQGTWTSNISIIQPPFLWQNISNPGQDFYQKIASNNTFLLSPPNGFRIVTDSFDNPNFVISIINNFARN